MKELSIEEKAKRYDEAFNVALETYQTQPMYKNWLEKMFPELKESEDEKIRKHLIKHFGNKSKEDWNDVPVKSILAWLEKQGEHADFLNKIQIGDKVTRNEDGVLVNLSQLNRVAKKQGEQKPVFEMKTPEESLGVDSGTYNKIVDECIYGEQKPACSEEDESRMDNLCHFLEEYGNQYYGHLTLQGTISWLKSLKDRVQPKQRWSEEDKKLIDDTCHLINTLASGYGEKVTELITLSGTQMIASIKTRLRALVDSRPQSTWKPSDEQMEALFEAHKQMSAYYHTPLLSLYNELKKL